MSEDGGALLWLGVLALASFFAAAAISFCLLLWFEPVLARYTLAKPNARSSHKVPAPQGGGGGVIAATVIVTGVVFVGFPGLANGGVALTTVIASAILLAVVGAIDDLRPLHPMPRLLLQAVAVAGILWACRANFACSRQSRSGPSNYCSSSPRSGL